MTPTAHAIEGQKQKVRLLLGRGEVSPMQAQIYIYFLLHGTVDEAFCASRKPGEVQAILDSVQQKIESLNGHSS